MKSKYLTVPLLATLALAACVKQQNGTNSTSSNQQVGKAKVWFEQTVLTQSPAPNPKNYRSTLSKTITQIYADVDEEKVLDDTAGWQERPDRKKELFLAADRHDNSDNVFVKKGQ